jgi:DNA polymerase-1
MKNLNFEKEGDIITLDLETQIHKSYKRVANPFDERNYCVMTGWKIGNQKCRGKYFKQKTNKIIPPLKSIRMMVGFNIKFDMLYFWKDKDWIKFLQDGGRIWDCQYVEYLLGGMTSDVQMCALADIALKYGGTSKLDVVKELWKQGVQTSEIPQDTLTAYLLGSEQDGIEGDIDNTHRVYLGQLERIEKLENPKAFLAMVANRMDGLLATTEMEYNGLFINMELAEPLRQEQIKTIEDSLKHLNSFLPELPEGVEFNWSSGTHRSCVLFGGALKYEKWTAHRDENGNFIYPKKTEKWPLCMGLPIHPDKCKLIKGLYYAPSKEGVGIQGASGDWWLPQDTYKSGKKQGEGKFKNVSLDNTDKPKGKKQIYAVDLPRIIEPREEWKISNVDADGECLYSTGSKVMDIVTQMNVPFCQSLRNYISSSKDLGTYFWIEDKNGQKKGMLTLVDALGFIHHKLNHTNTLTSRLTSNDPNMQNIPRQGTSKVKQFFTSRFGDRGLMLGLDYKQLEIIVQAILTNDENLINDIINEIDFHCRRLAMMLGQTYEEVLERYLSGDEATAEIRVKAKNFSFARAFGAGAKAVVDQTGLDLEVVKQMIVNEDIMYPGVKQFDNWLRNEITNNMTSRGGTKVLVGDKVVMGKSSTWQSPFGTIYKWVQHAAPEYMQENGVQLTFSPTERKNYPVQGTGGEIVQTVLGRTFRWWIRLPEEDRENLKMVNTVHDCVIWDGVVEYLKKHYSTIKNLMEAVDVFYKEDYGIDLPVHFRVDGEIGHDLYTMTSMKTYLETGELKHEIS